MKILINFGSLLLSKALGEQLEREPEGFKVVAEWGGRLRPESFQPDFILVDRRTIGLVAPCIAPEVKLLLIDTGLGEGEIASLLLTYRIDGVMATISDLNLLKKAISAISFGQIWIDNRKIRALVNHAENGKDPGRREGLSKKEQEIVTLIAKGLTNREIASVACISPQTVKTHVSRIFRKMNVSRRSQLVPLAMQLSLSDL